MDYTGLEGFNPSQVTPERDAFGRFRVSAPETIFDSKLSTANYALFWNFLQVSGTCTSTYSKARASNTLAVNASTAGLGVWQTKQRFNYQPGKSQLVMMTGVMAGLKAGITYRIGIFDDDNGLFFEVNAGGLRVARRSKVTGAVVDTYVDDEDFIVSGTNGTGLRTLRVDYTKAQIFLIDFESLQVGTVRFGLAVDGQIVYLHAMNHANLIDSAYFSTPNLPLRYELVNDGTGAAATLECICSTVISEGGSQETGITRYLSTAVHVDANSTSAVYAVVGIRLKAANLDSVVKVAAFSMINIAASTNDFEWLLILNPTVAGAGGDAFTYADVTNSAVQAAYGKTANTVTGGTLLAGGFAQGNETTQALVNSLYYLGATIANVRDEIVLCVRPLSANEDIHGSITIKEIA
jgi:hypothetical protein